MKLSSNLNDALCEQIIHELSNVVKYMDIASYFEKLQLKKLSNYFMNQSNHEKDHADKFIKHINDRTGGNVSIGEIPKPIQKIESFQSAAEIYVKTEEETTLSIESIYKLALDERSYIDLGFLQSMLNEQVEEEDSANKFATTIKNVRDIVLFDATFEG